MSKVKKQTTPTYSIVDLNSMEFDILLSCILAAPIAKVKKALMDDGLDVPPGVIGETINKLWADLNDSPGKS